MVAEHDPAEVLQKLGARGKLVHLKDGPGNRQDPMTALGDGVQNWPHILQAAEPHAEWLVVELDRCGTDMMTAVEKSYRYLADKGWGHGADKQRA